VNFPQPINSAVPPTLTTELTLTDEVLGAPDILERDDALKMLELRHRTKNILAIIQSLINQTLRGGVSIDDARRNLSDRIVAMGAAIDLLMRHSWEPALLSEVAIGALAHRASYHGRITIEGPDLAVGPGAALAISLALHELESNAIKYGALSNCSGKVCFMWSVQDRGSVKIRWSESGGPPVEAPTKMGFGTKLIGPATGKRLGGVTEMHYLPDGVQWILTSSTKGLAS
jgi:two-component sensor histidine kinase